MKGKVLNSHLLRLDWITMSISSITMNQYFQLGTCRWHLYGTTTCTFCTPFSSPLCKHYTVFIIRYSIVGDCTLAIWLATSLHITVKSDMYSLCTLYIPATCWSVSTFSCFLRTVVLSFVFFSVHVLLLYFNNYSSTLPHMSWHAVVCTVSALWLGSMMWNMSKFRAGTSTKHL